MSTKKFTDLFRKNVHKNVDNVDNYRKTAEFPGLALCIKFLKISFLETVT